MEVYLGYVPSRDGTETGTAITVRNGLLAEPNSKTAG